MERMEWDEKFRIGVEKVDKAHAKLFRITNRLLAASEDTRISPNAYKEGIKYLEAYSMTHFAEEETYMRSIRYKGYAHHKRIHDTFREKTLVSLKRDLELSGYSAVAVRRVASTMNNWLKEHIMQEDQAIVGKAVSRSSRDLENQIPVICKFVNRAMQEVFQTEAKLISSGYKGQNIGTGYYCRHFYDIEGGARVQLLLAVEELLLLRGVNRIPGMQALEKEELTDEIVHPIFEQLFQSLSKLFRVETEYEFGKDKLLTRDGFRNEFMKGYPCSLLFDTKVGHFVFCYRSRWIRKQ